jgi:hypothetical protein
MVPLVLWLEFSFCKLKKSAEPEENQESAKDIHPSKNTQFLFFLVSKVLMGFCFMQWFHTVPVFIKMDWEFDEGYIGLLLAITLSLARRRVITCPISGWRGP